MNDLKTRAFCFVGAAITLLIASFVAETSRAAVAPDANRFKGKPVRVVVDYEPGGSANLFGRLIVKHLSSHLTGSPRMVG